MNNFLINLELKCTLTCNLRAFVSKTLYIISIRVKFRYSFLIEFKYIISLNLNIIRKDNIVYISLVNTTMYLNSINKLNIPNLKRGCSAEQKWFCFGAIERIANVFVGRWVSWMIP